MTTSDPLDAWLAAEKIAESQAALAAKNTSNFFDTTTKFFHVTFDFNQEVKPRQASLNSATCQIGLAFEHTQNTAWPLPEAYAKPLSDAIDQAKDIAAQMPPEKVLPLYTFGVLPIFSTAYVAQFLTGLPDKILLSTNIAYAIAIRCMFMSVFDDLLPRASMRSKGLRRHPFVAYHVCLALKKFDKLEDQVKTTLLSIAQEQPDELWKRLLAAKGGPGFERKAEEEDNLLELKNEFSERINIMEGPSNHIFSGNNTAELVARSLSAIEEMALRDIALEVASASRADKFLVDPSSLGFALLTLAELNVRKHHVLISQGLEVLFSAAAGGQFFPGRPFFSDGKGRSLLVPSVEVANAALQVALRSVEAGVTSRVEIAAVLSSIKAHQDALLEDLTTIRVKNAANTEIMGWCSDRSAAGSRVESWTTGQAMDFFQNYVKLLRYAKRMHVMSQYQSISFQDPQLRRVPWGELQDPNEGSAADGVKDHIMRLVQRENPGEAPIFLLYGPPGTSKTTLAKSLANDKGWDVISISPSDFVSDSLDKVEFRSREIFRDLMMVDKAVVVFDEIDSLLRDRDIFRERPGTIIEFVVPALLPKLQEFHDYVEGKEIAVFFLTNYFESVDLAIRRAGRIDAHIPILPYARTALNKVMEKQCDGYAKKGMSMSPQKWTMLMSVMKLAPCHFVFQDVNAIIRETLKSSVSSESDITKIVSKRGISPQSYLSQYRKHSEQEFCLVAARALELDASPIFVDDRKNMIEILDAAIKQIERQGADEKALSSRWLEPVKHWQNQLTSP